MDRIFALSAVLLGLVALGVGVRSTTASGPANPGADALDWAVLTAYEYEPGLLGLPDAVGALDGKQVTLRGYLEPLYEFDDIHEFVLVPHAVHGSGGLSPTRISAVVQVTMPKQSAGLRNDAARLRVEGTFRVVETREQGYILSIFRIEGARVTVDGEAK